MVDDPHAVEAGGLSGAGITDRVEAEGPADHLHVHLIIAAPCRLSVHGIL